LTRKEELHAFLSQKKEKDPKSVTGPSELLKSIKKEMAVYESTEEIPPYLEKIRKALRTLPPSSSEAERCFSAAGLFITKLRTSLKDETLDFLFFLRSYLQKIQKS
jgi:hypothetical protein